MAMRELQKSSVDDMIGFLNDLLVTDPDCLTRLMQLRMVCNEKMENHPTVQVGENGARSVVGLMGIINGFFGTIPDGDCKDHGFITMLFDKDHNIIQFIRTETYMEQIKQRS